MVARLTRRFLVWTLPFWWFLIRLVWRVLGRAFLLAFAGLVGLVRGIPESIEKMAAEWSDIMLGWGIPLSTLEHLSPVLRVWGLLLMFTGWVFIGLIAGIIVGLIL